MDRLRGQLTAAIAAAVLTACGSNSSTSSPSAATTRGTLQETPPLRIASLDAATLKADLAVTSSGAQLLQVTGTPTCGVDFYYLKFWTVGGAGETTLSTGAMMVPTGGAPTCSGPRPIVLFAHATETNKLLNLANIADPTNTEGALIAAMFAAQGYIVVAPNYAGYDISTLGYHPFLNATQQSGEMIDILTAARAASADDARGGLRATTANCSSAATPREATSRWRPCVRWKRPGRRSPPRLQCPVLMRSRHSAMRWYSEVSISALQNLLRY